jgi:nitroreductase
MLAEPTFNIFYGASCLIVVCARPPVQQSMEDCCLAAQNLLLAAHAQGLGTCWIGFARPWLELAETRTELAIPADCLPVAPIIVGFPATLPSPVERRKPIVIWPVAGGAP